MSAEAKDVTEHLRALTAAHREARDEGRRLHDEITMARTSRADVVSGAVRAAEPIPDNPVPGLMEAQRLNAAEQNARKVAVNREAFGAFDTFAATVATVEDAANAEIERVVTEALAAVTKLDALVADLESPLLAKAWSHDGPQPKVVRPVSYTEIVARVAGLRGALTELAGR
jgi:hypothetical protein